MNHLDTYIQEKRAEFNKKWSDDNDFMKNYKGERYVPLHLVEAFQEATIRTTAKETLEDYKKTIELAISEEVKKARKNTWYTNGAVEALSKLLQIKNN